VSAVYHLAQLNIATMKGPVDGPVMAGFVAQLNEVNALADEAPGFVWRLQSADGDATSIRAFEDDRILVNMSVWESVQALRDYVYGGRHLEVVRNRSQWFEGATRPYQVLWWVPAGHTPDVEEAKRKLEHLETYGPTAEAFSFQQVFEAPSVVVG
jgi:hypothetical protein